MTEMAVIVTGASRGLGAATARLAAQLGAAVALVARSADDLERVAGEIRDTGGQALPLVGDVTRAGDCERVVAGTVERFGRLDALVNNAGILEPIAPLAEMEAGAWEKNWAVNVLGPALMIRQALPHLRKRQGRILNVSSGAAVHAIPGWSAYCLAKAAINHLGRMLAAEEPEVTTLAFRPGVVDTAMQATIRRDGAQGMPGEDHERFVRYHQQGELLPPEAPGCALAVLALYAPQSWNGEFVAWDEEQVQSLVRRYACAQGR
ncbi:MAG: SDR family NAD(P)-dependent oxidoreductase [Anaerolineae bacterium]|jgi:NAD(P)-dependent dehydrogenase (short-subunit alcohol dehydrogenase family)